MPLSQNLPATGSGFDPASLPERLKQKSPQAFVQLYDNYSAVLFNQIVKAIKDYHLSQDLLQNVFVKVWTHIDQYDPAKSGLYAWMSAICRNEVIDHFRGRCNKQWRRTSFSIDQLPESGTLPSWNRPDVLYVFSQLSTGQKILVDLIYFKGMSLPQVAVLLSLPLGTVKTRVRTLLKKWQKNACCKAA